MKELYLKLGLFPIEDYKLWYKKYITQQKSSSKRGLENSLTFTDYLELAHDAGIISPKMIGRSIDSFQLGRIMDSGGYHRDNVRFITFRENIDEKVISGVTQRAALKMRGRTKETCSGLQSASEKKKGRTKSNHEGICSCAMQKSRAFLIYNSTELYIGRNMQSCCNILGLRSGCLSLVLHGCRKSHKGFKGRWLSDKELLLSTGQSNITESEQLFHKFLRFEEEIYYILNRIDNIKDC